MTTRRAFGPSLWRSAAAAALLWFPVGAHAQRTEAPRIAVAETLLAAPESKVLLRIAIEPADAAPRHSFVRLKGLPSMVSLTDGHAIASGSWAVPLVALAGLHINVPAGVSGRSEILVNLVGEDGALLAEAKVTLIIAPIAAAVDPAAKRPGLSPSDREAAEKLIARGERDMQDGNVALARQFFLRAAEAGLPRAALLLAGTYDPRELARQRVQGVQPNPALARKWYERARELGAPEAEERLSNLGGG